MQVRFLLGPAGSGKTFRCLQEIRQALSASPDGPALVMISPKQATYQIERQLLADPALPGYTRLHILSFERLAEWVFQRLDDPGPQMLDEEGRVMVLRSLLAKKRDDLKLFKASARLTGFARQLSGVLREFQRQQITPEDLGKLAARSWQTESLSGKLHDLGTLLDQYLAWLRERGLQDADGLLDAATRTLRESPQSAARIAIDQIWIDGFAQYSEQELDVLAALLPCARKATLAFCLAHEPQANLSWLSHWSVVNETCEQCRRRLGEVPGVDLSLELLAPRPGENRFQDNPVLSHLERQWNAPQPYAGSGVEGFLRMVECADPEMEATVAAREILRHVRAGGRYREVSVLVRTLEPYYHPLRRVFERYEIPFFMDRREPVSHHPLAELTRSALRTVATGWLQEDWFAALKTGLVPADDEEIDRLENEALARGWSGAVWKQPPVVKDDPRLTAWLAELHRRLLPPFQELALALEQCGKKPTGPQLASALRQLWRRLHVEERLQEWATLESAAAGLHFPNPVHATVWDQMNAWLRNLELAFPQEALPLRDWLPILEAGLANLSVGVIPPALDQVLIGAMDRSRNPEIKLALVLGMNETVFPAPPESAVLLTETDRLELEKSNVLPGTTARRHLARERYLAYIACTRARSRLVLTHARQDADGSSLNPSLFLSTVTQLFPSLAKEVAPPRLDWQECEHPRELTTILLRASAGSSAQAGEPHSAPPGSPAPPILSPKLARAIAAFPRMSLLLDQLERFQNPIAGDSLTPGLATRLYGPTLRTSVSRIEQFAACPFRFLVHSGLRAEERQRFEADAREQGTFQHDVLALFHDQLARERKRWRDITPAQARERVGQIAQTLIAAYRDGLFESSDQTRFLAQVLTGALQDLVATLVGWMRDQYQFDPVAVELPFGDAPGAPAWSLDLGNERRLELYGRIDRIDVSRQATQQGAWCVVVDYKSSHKQLDPLFLQHGLQLQLLAYLNVLRHWPNPLASFGVEPLLPAGVFYVNVRGDYGRESNRGGALQDPDQARKLAYQHTGRFDTAALQFLDARPDRKEGDQFNYRLTKTGKVHGGCREAVDSSQFSALLDSVEANLKNMGQQIFAGATEVSPFRKGRITACDQCGYQAICRIDPWFHQFRVLRNEAATTPRAEE